MDSIGNIPYSTAEFGQDGRQLLAPALPGSTREIIIVSHGWNNDRGAAESLYRMLFERVAAVHAEGTAGLAIVGVIWPSKKFDFSDEAQKESRNAVGAASLGGDGAEERQRSLDRQFAEFEALFEDSPNGQELSKLRPLLGQLDQPAAQADFIRKLRCLVDAPDDRSDLDASSFFFEANDPQDVFRNARQASADVGTSGTHDGGTMGAAGLSDVFDGIGNAVSSLLNITTYYEMKKRAGTVGALGVAPLIDALAQRDEVQRIHLVGHSFGARLVTAAAMHSTTPKLYGMFLLQAAFSHNAFSEAGYFRDVIARHRLAGPIVITHTVNDTAVGKHYAIASRISGDDAAGLGDPSDKYGGLGRNGALNIAAEEVSRDSTVLLESGASCNLRKKLIHNLESSRFIKDHGDVAGEEVAWVISRGIALA